MKKPSVFTVMMTLLVSVIIMVFALSGKSQPIYPYTPYIAPLLQSEDKIQAWAALEITPTNYIGVTNYVYIYETNSTTVYQTNMFYETNAVVVNLTNSTTVYSTNEVWQTNNVLVTQTNAVTNLTGTAYVTFGYFDEVIFTNFTGIRGTNMVDGTITTQQLATAVVDLLNAGANFTPAVWSGPSNSFNLNNGYTKYTTTTDVAITNISGGGTFGELSISNNTAGTLNVWVTSTNWYPLSGTNRIVMQAYSKGYVKLSSIDGVNYELLASSYVEPPAAPVTPEIIAETFESGALPSGWTALVGTPEWNATGLVGNYSVGLTNGDYIYVNLGSARTTITNVFPLILGTTNYKAFHITSYDNGFNTRQFRVRTDVNNKLELVTGGGTSIGVTTDAMVANITNWVRIAFIAGSGANAVLSAEFSPTKSFTGSGNKFIGTGSATNTLGVRYLAFEDDQASGQYLRIDNFGVSATNSLTQGWP